MENGKWKIILTVQYLQDWLVLERHSKPKLNLP
jgi:hypothetical protein